MKAINNLIEKRALDIYRLKDFSHEYGAFIALALIAKLLLSIFNGYAGYYLIKNYLVSEFNNEKSAILVAVTFLLMIEIFLNLSLTFFFKTSLRGNIKGAIGLVLLSGVFFGISFLVTTNGLAQRQAQKADNTQVIIDKYNLQASETKKQAEIDKNQIQNAIETIKQNPSGWRSGKRDVLQTNQLRDINNYYSSIEQINTTLRNDLMEIEINRKQELKDNTGNVLVVETRYYKTAIGVMVFQLFINGLLMFFYSRIYGHTEKEQLTKDTVQKFASDIADTTDQLIKENIQNQYIRYMNALSFQLAKEDIKTIPIVSKNSKKIGFTNTDDEQSNNPSVITDGKTNKVTNVTDELKQCKSCGKSFKPYNIKHVFCTSDCKLNWHKENKGFDLSKLRYKHK